MIISTQDRAISFDPAFRITQKALGATPWYLSGGVALANCIAAYQPKGAANLAASYVNLANPGTYNAAPGVAPGWNASDGWIGDGLSKYLDTGITPAAQSWSIIIRFSGGSSTGGTLAGMVNTVGGVDRFYYQFGANPIYANGQNVASPGVYIASGVIALAGAYGYKNGVQDVGPMSAGAGIYRSVYILAQHRDATIINYSTANIQAMAIYNATLTPAQVAALTTAMNAL